ncbi:unnamed protein product [Bursaphelenchus xylophilus]|uniref:(pine wood nematode) hypothetical protein n=1 Tax=Bursaphelenchus xylophilus TaxID=6326 RepID=A0A811KRZ8_BURXY|nr:unnamed protein product [Bursaphelenchus xylophilus]CAG9102611.1 unnamed protein product [Bursaphelenchus xylophilus]
MEPIDEILTTTQASFARVTYTTPYTTLYSLSPSASAQAVVGETANLPCRAYGVNSYDSRISWEKLDDVMPSQFRISDTSLLIPKVKKADAGTYRCIVDTVDGQNHLAIAELIVGDYIPTFDGSRIIEITPLTHEQWQRLDLEVSFRPSKENGVIYHAERHVHSSEPQLFHNIAMRKGHVVYTFDIGSGVSRVQSPVSIKMGEWSKVRIRNDDKKVSLNVNQQTSGHSRNAPLPNIKETNDGTVYLGGIPEYSGHYDQLKRPDNFAGSISKLVVNGKSIDIGESATSPPEVILQLSTNECFENPCQNAAQCSPAHELEGFRCQCEPEFTGELCQFRTAVCANREVCQHGVCVDADWGEYRCVCPYGRFGKYCEHLKTDLPLITYDKMGRARQGVKFNGKTSFISIPAPQSSRHFRLSFDILPKNVKSPQLLAYVASSYNSKKADYMALVVQNEALYGLYHTSQGTERIQSYGRIQPNKTHEIGFLHSGSTLELLVDGRRTMQTLHSPVFSTGTALYIGGLAPGMSPIEELDSYGYFEGCLSSIRVNRQLIEVDSTRDVKSGDLGECSLNTEEVLVTSSPGVVRPIYIPPSRPGNEYLTPGESQPNSEHYQESVTMKPDRTLEPMAITHLMGSEDERIPRVTELPTTTMEAPKEKTTIEKTTETTSTSAILATTPSTTTTSTTSTTPAATTTITIEEATTRQTLQYDWTPPPTTIEQSPTATTLTPISEEPTTTEGSIWWVNEAPAATTTQFPSTEPPTNPSTTIHVITKDQPLYTTVIQPKTTTTTAEYPTKSSTISTAPHSVLPSSYTSPPTHHVLPPDQTAPPPTSNPYLTHSQNLETTRYTELISTDLQLTPTYQAKPTMVSYEEEDLVSTDIIRPTVERLDEVRTGLCEDADCGEHGICEAVNTTHVACACRDYYVGPNCDQFKPIEYAARFEGNAFIVFSVDDFPHLTSEKREIIEFRFRTTAEYGLMLWQGQSLDNSIVGEDYVSIGLNDGFLVFSYELGGGAAQITSEMPVNDGKEHYLRVERRGRNGSLIIDNQEPVEGRSSGILAMLNVEGNIYIGGLPDLATMTAGLHSHNFVGCIADLRLNEDPLDLMGNAIDGRNVKPCEGWTRKRKWLQQKYRRFLRHG